MQQVQGSGEEKTAPQTRRSGGPARAERSKGILVLGMHRSGTSAMVRVLNLLGCALPDELVAAADGNALGHWESLAAVELNDEVLASAGSSWEDWGPINSDWRDSGLRPIVVKKIAKIVEEHSDLGPLFAIKDPRMCRLADLWLEAMDLAKVDSRVVLMIRNPAEVVMSLESRDLMAPAYGQLLWLRHALDAEFFTRGRHRVVARYDQLMSNWPQLIEQQIKAGLGVALPRNAPAVHMEIDAFLNRGHQHQQSSLETVLGDPAVSSWLRDAYRVFLKWGADGENAADYSELDRIRKAFDEAYAAFGRLLLPMGVSGQYDAGSSLKRELAESRSALSEAEISQARGEELRAELEAATVEARRLEAELRQELAAEIDRRANAEAEARSVNAQLSERVMATAELSGRLAMSDSMLRQRQEELSQVWNDLVDKERRLGVSEATAEREKERRIVAEKRLDDLRKDLDVQTSALKKQAAQNRDLLDDARRSHSEAERRLSGRHEEIAKLTTILAEQSHANEAALSDKAWLGEMMLATSRMPKWWVLLPVGWRRKREHEFYRRAGLFDVRRYLDTYPDVAQDGMDPVQHYIAHGIFEARQRPQ